jgi:hypothetical protein
VLEHGGVRRPQRVSAALAPRGKSGLLRRLVHPASERLRRDSGERAVRVRKQLADRRRGERRRFSPNTSPHRVGFVLAQLLSTPCRDRSPIQTVRSTVSPDSAPGPVSLGSRLTPGLGGLRAVPGSSSHEIDDRESGGPPDDEPRPELDEDPDDVLDEVVVHQPKRQIRLLARQLRGIRCADPPLGTALTS